MKAEPFESIRDTAVESRMWHGVSTAGNRLAAAWSDSGFARKGRELAAAVDGWTEVDRVRRVAVTVASAALFHLLLVSISPVYVAPGLPRGWVVAVAVAAALVAIAPSAFMKAWKESRARRIGRRLIGGDSSHNNDR